MQKQLKIYILFMFISTLSSCNTANQSNSYRVTLECIPGDTLKYEYFQKYNTILPDSLAGDLRIVNKPFPFYYGYISDSIGGDGDFLDAIFISNKTFPRGSEISSLEPKLKIVVLDNNEFDDKLLFADVTFNLNDVIDWLVTYSSDEIRILEIYCF